MYAGCTIYLVVLQYFLEFLHPNSKYQAISLTHHNCMHENAIMTIIGKHGMQPSRRLLQQHCRLLLLSFSVMCLTTTFIVAILGMIAALKYRIHTLCPTKPPRFPSDSQNFVGDADENQEQSQQDENLQDDQSKTDQNMSF